MIMRVLLFLLVWIFAAVPLSASDRTLTLSFGSVPRVYTAAEFLAHPKAVPLTIPKDVSYHREMTYRAVPLLALLGDVSRIALNTIEARASDGFVSQIPLELVSRGATGGSVAWIAVENPTKPWPNLPDRRESGGPFYLVWEHPKRSNVGSEQWPFALAALTGVDDPVRRWPRLAVDAGLAADHPARRGQALFIKNCLPCHRLSGAGVAEMGPDLGQPMPVTHYFTAAGLRALIRDPKSVRTWPRQQMPAFGADDLTDADIDAIVAYLTVLGERH
jgi:mono/diheme cytochrome c family protein